MHDPECQCDKLEPPNPPHSDETMWCDKCHHWCTEGCHYCPKHQVQ